MSSQLCVEIKKKSFLMVTLACFRKRRKPSSSGRRIRSAWPLPSMPLAVLPTLWMYSCGHKVKLNNQSEDSFRHNWALWQLVQGCATMLGVTLARRISSFGL